MSEKKENSPYLNQSNIISTSFYKTTSVTAIRTIKYGLYNLSQRWKKNKIYEKKYKNINLFEMTNWKDDNFDWEDFSCDFSVVDYCENLNISYGGKQRNEIKKAISKATKEIIMISNEVESEWFPWFVKAIYKYDNSNPDTNEIKLVFHPGIIAVALGQTENYSHLELEILGKLKSIYAIRYYELIKSRYNMKGKAKYKNKAGSWSTELLTIEFLKEFLNIPASAYANRMDNFKSRVINLPIKEINESCENIHVEIEYIKEGKGNKLKGVILHCSEKENLVKNIDDVKEIATYKDDTNILIEEYQKKYSDKWDKMREELEKSSLPFMQGVLLDMLVVEELKKLEDLDKEI